MRSSVPDVLYVKSEQGRYSPASLPEVGSYFIKQLLDQGRTRLSFQILHLMVEELGKKPDMKSEDGAPATPTEVP